MTGSGCVIRMAAKPAAVSGIFINVVDMVDLCTSAKARAAQTQDEGLNDAATSVMSALVLHLGARHAEIPVALRPHYELLTGEKGP